MQQCCKHLIKDERTPPMSRAQQLAQLKFAQALAQLERGYDDEDDPLVGTALAVLGANDRAHPGPASGHIGVQYIRQPAAQVAPAAVAERNASAISANTVRLSEAEKMASRARSKAFILECCKFHGLTDEQFRDAYFLLESDPEPPRLRTGDSRGRPPKRHIEWSEEKKLFDLMVKGVAPAVILSRAEAEMPTIYKKLKRHAGRPNDIAEAAWHLVERARWVLPRLVQVLALALVVLPFLVGEVLAAGWATVMGKPVVWSAGVAKAAVQVGMVLGSAGLAVFALVLVASGYPTAPTAPTTGSHGVARRAAQTAAAPVSGVVTTIRTDAGTRDSSQAAVADGLAATAVGGSGGSPCELIRNRMARPSQPGEESTQRMLARLTRGVGATTWDIDLIVVPSLLTWNCFNGGSLDLGWAGLAGPYQHDEKSATCGYLRAMDGKQWVYLTDTQKAGVQRGVFFPDADGDGSCGQWGIVALVDTEVCTNKGIMEPPWEALRLPLDERNPNLAAELGGGLWRRAGSRDSDGDTLPDWFEVGCALTDAGLADTDGDGRSDAEEVNSLSGWRDPIVHEAAQFDPASEQTSTCGGFAPVYASQVGANPDDSPDFSGRSSETLLFFTRKTPRDATHGRPAFERLCRHAFRNGTTQFIHPAAYRSVFWSTQTDRTKSRSLGYIIFELDPSKSFVHRSGPLPHPIDTPWGTALPLVETKSGPRLLRAAGEIAEERRQLGDGRDGRSATMRVIGYAWEPVCPQPSAIP